MILEYITSSSDNPSEDIQNFSNMNVLILVLGLLTNFLGFGAVVEH